MKTRRLINLSLFILIIGLLATACDNKQSSTDSKVLADTDRSYSALSSEKGMNAAFLAMFDSAAVLLRANHNPVEGFEAIKGLLLSESDSSFSLVWEPTFAKISASGDMGYTYGTYFVTDKSTDSITGKGTYATIWKKDSNGKWKAMLDTGNPGLGK
jgi:ketosteroid isomerase-like protein